MADLPDDAVVVRYGEVMRPTDLALSALKHAMQYAGVYALSVNSIPGLTPDEVAARGCRPNRRYCFTTVKTLREAGFTFGHKPDDDGHTNVIMPSPPTADDLARFAGCFTGTGVNPNPVPPTKR